MEKIKFNHKAETINKALGVSNQRENEILKEFNDIMAEKIAGDAETVSHSELLEAAVIVAKTPEEQVLAVYQASIIIEQKNRKDGLLKILKEFNDNYFQEDDKSNKSVDTGPDTTIPFMPGKGGSA